jgi:PAS domain S-box-containing protein
MHGGIMADIWDTANRIAEQEHARCTHGDQPAPAHERALESITQVALSSLCLAGLLRTLVRQVREFLAADTATILLLSADGQQFEALASAELEDKVERQVRIPVGRGVAGRIIAGRRPLVEEELPETEVASPILPAHVRSLAGVPLLVRGRPIGVLHVGSLRPHRFSAKDVRLLQRVAGRIAPALENARLFEAERQARREITNTLARITDAVIALDRHWRFTYVNDGAERLLARRREELLGRNLWAEFPEAAGGPFDEAYHRAMASQQTEVAEVYNPQLGAWFEARAYPSPEGLTIYFRDISKRRQAEDESARLLADVERRASELDATIAAIPDGLFVYDAAGTIQRVNPAGERLLHYTPEIRALPLAERMALLRTETPERQPVPLERLPNVRALHGELVEGETMVMHPPSGPAIWVSASAAPIRAADGSLLGAVLALRDITPLHALQEERERLLGEVQSRAAELAAVIENTDAQLALLDRAFDFVLVNSAYAQGSGYSKEELVGRNHFALFPNPENQAIFERVRDTGTLYKAIEKPFEYTSQPERGVTYWNWALVPIKGRAGQVEALLLSLLDVTPQVRARQRIEALAQEVRRRAAELEATLSAIADGLIIYGPEGEIVRMNRTAESILGVRHTEWRAALPEERGLAAMETPDGRPLAPGDLPHNRALRGEAVVGYRTVVARSDGTRRDLVVSAAPIRDAEGRILGAVATYGDVTHMVEMQRQREDILRAVSHDLRNPLAAVLGQAQLLERRLARAGNARERVNAEAIASAAQRMNTMIQDLVDAARSEAGQMQLERRAIDLRAFALELKEQLAPALETARIVVRVPEGLPAVWADPARLERILTNLWSNALKYSAPGTSVTVSAWQEKDLVITSIADRGPGIAPEEQRHLFQRYSRTATGRAQREGIGLGLYITRVLVEAHGGHVWVESTVGVGSTFFFSLPVVEQQTHAAIP